MVKADEILSERTKRAGRIVLLQLGQKAIEEALKPLTGEIPVSGRGAISPLQDREAALRRRLNFWEEMKQFPEAEDDSYDSLEDKAGCCAFSDEEKIEANEMLRTMCKEKGAFSNWSTMVF